MRQRDHLGDAVLGDLAGCRLGRIARDDCDRFAAALLRQVEARMNSGQRSLGERSPLMLRENQNVTHFNSLRVRDRSSRQITLASVWRTATSSCTDATLRPAWRFGGAAIVFILSLGTRSTPRLSAAISFSSFLRAFMIPGSDA